MNMDIAKIKTKISRYKSALAAEKRKFGFYHDGAGRRYVIGPLYVSIGDIKGALKYYAWFEENFPDDTGEPFQYLAWTLALYRSGDPAAARRKLVETMFQNLYIIPRLAGIAPPPTDIELTSNWEFSDYQFPEGHQEIWDEEAVNWARTVYLSPPVQYALAREIELKRKLKDEQPGPERNRLLRAIRDLEESVINSI
jgi:hypothetical protein